MFDNIDKAKQRAKELGKILRSLGIDAQHSDCLDVIAQAASSNYSDWHALAHALKNGVRLEIDDYQFQQRLMTILSDSLPDEQLAPVMMKFCGSRYKRPSLMRRPLVLENGDLAPATFNLFNTAPSQAEIDDLNKRLGNNSGFFTYGDSPLGQAMKATADRMFGPYRMATAALDKQKAERQERIDAKKLFVVRAKKKA